MNKEVKDGWCMMMSKVIEENVEKSLDNLKKNESISCCG